MATCRSTYLKLSLLAKMMTILVEMSSLNKNNNSIKMFLLP